MTQHCTINGEPCAKCCEVLTLRNHKRLRDWIAYVRRYGYPADFDGDRLYHRLRQISKRRAKKRNPYLVSIVGSNQAYFTCKDFTGNGCGDYANRPYMCSGYPYYGDGAGWRSTQVGRPGLYHQHCTYYCMEENK